MRHVRRVRLATAFPFVLGVFSGTLITAFLFLAVRSIDDLEGDGSPFPGLEAVNEESKALSARENELQPPESTGERRASFLPRRIASFNVLISSDTRGLAVEKTWASAAKTKQDAEFYLLPSVQLEEETVAAMKKRVQVTSLVTKDDVIYGRNNYQGVFDLWRDICERKLDKYHWFVQLKDNVYVQAEKLERLLSSLNSSKPILIGHSITPVGYARDELGLREGESYCFEGGYAVSWKTLEMVCPFLSACQDGSKSENEDVEIARCIREHAGINCTANLQVHASNILLIHIMSVIQCELSIVGTLIINLDISSVYLTKGEVHVIMLAEHSFQYSSVEVLRS